MSFQLSKWISSLLGFWNIFRLLFLISWSCLTLVCIQEVYIEFYYINYDVYYQQQCKSGSMVGILEVAFLYPMRFCFYNCSWNFEPHFFSMYWVCILGSLDILAHTLLFVLNSVVCFFLFSFFFFPIAFGFRNEILSEFVMVKKEKKNVVSLQIMRSISWWIFYF